MIIHPLYILKKGGVRMPRMEGQKQLNFQYNYVRDENFMRRLQYEKKEDLLKEARRLSAMTGRRIAQIEKRNLESHQVDLLKARTEIIRQKADIAGTYKTVSTKMSESQLRDLIRTYDRYLTKETSTWQGVEKKAETFKSIIDNSKFKDDVTIEDITRVQKILDNTYITNKLFDIFGYGSQTQIDLIVNSQLDAKGFEEKFEQLADNKNLLSKEDMDNLRKVFNFFDAKTKKQIEEEEEEEK